MAAVSSDTKNVKATRCSGDCVSRNSVTLNYCRSALSDTLPAWRITSSLRISKKQVLRKRPYLTKEMCIRVVQSPIRVELQERDRYRFWGSVDELEGRFLRVVTLSDKLTIHNAFFDRRFRP